MEDDPVVVRIRFVAVIEPPSGVLVKLDVTTVHGFVNTNSRVEEVRTAVAVRCSRIEDLE
jgi:hypothetical protein